jgi:hypothetical protein
MKKFILGLAILLGCFTASAQLNPVNWNFTVKKIADKTYELRAKATMQQGWHLYSQNQPKDAIAIPTGFTIQSNPLFKLDGKMKEIGNLEKFHDKTLDVSANQYSNSVDFVQIIKMKTTAKTNISGSVEYQTCNDEKCLPPKTVPFSLAIK